MRKVHEATVANKDCGWCNNVKCIARSPTDSLSVVKG
ncbi:unnamed protein product [Acanthoscelides obtectus]|uniref:Uncharacterized protein n=1 Tax=Acanthoscelides obtectus TaxID=200917 RepID=A0A9P0PDI0_ACAOB|nr:unnamed protein product [Acanthoscelides obtectus]CAK1656204.1 hypothetical protein AOBTE_LOCUS19613 [Acanthoscelides obtectus]